MTELDTRLRSLSVSPVPDGPTPGDLRRRASRRARRRRVAVLATAVPALVVVALVTVALLGGQPTEQVRTDPAPATSNPPSSSTTTGVAPGPDGTRVLGGVQGVSVGVTPRTDLRDGDLVTVTAGGLEQLPNAQILMCAGDATAEDAAASCTPTAIQQAGTEGQVFAAEEQTVSVSRVIQITRGAADPNRPEPYDCATEPAGCVLAVGPFELPPRAVLVPVSFINDAPPPTPTLTISPTTDLADGQTVTVRAEGLRPNGSFVIGQCSSGDSVNCGAAAGSPKVTSDAGGTLDANVVVVSVVYSASRGRIDCTASPCAITIRDETYQDLASVPISFAPAVDAPIPELTIDPPGPYTQGQEVTVSGTGFPVAERVRLGQCPVGLDTAVVERCSYPIPLMAILAEPDGTFTATAELSLGTALGPCGPDLPCYLGWVLNNGPTVATAPLPTTG